jgi:hypothetical protein
MYFLIPEPPEPWPPPPPAHVRQLAPTPAQRLHRLDEAVSGVASAEAQTLAEAEHNRRAIRGLAPDGELRGW